MQSINFHPFAARRRPSQFLPAELIDPSETSLAGRIAGKDRGSRDFLLQLAGQLYDVV